MSLKRIWVIFVSRNWEFFRDRAAFGWNFLFPFLIIAGFAVIFGEDTFTDYRVGVFPAASAQVSPETLDLPEAFTQSPYLRFIGFSSRDEALDSLRHHRIDFLVQPGSSAPRYWVTDSPGGYVVEQILKASLVPEGQPAPPERQTIRGTRVRYIDWLFPGILAMNMMFSALWGIGFVIVRYRKNGVLKRLKATPLRPFEYLTAQMLSRIFLLMFTIVVIWAGCDLVFDFQVRGSYLDIFLVYLVGGLSLCSVGLIIASRGISEEFASGMVNFASWPMMFLSEVWFSLEGAPEWVRTAAEVLPLTHLLRAARRIMNEGADLAAVSTELLILLAMTLGFLLIGSWMFSWTR